MSSKVKMLSKKVASVVKKTKVKCLKNILRHMEEFLGEIFQDWMENRYHLYNFGFVSLRQKG